MALYDSRWGEAFDTLGPELAVDGWDDFNELEHAAAVEYISQRRRIRRHKTLIISVRSPSRR